MPLITLLTIANNVSKIGSPNTIKGAINTIAVYVFATPIIDITANEYPKKLEPVSPIYVLAGLKLYGRKPTMLPASAVINIIGTIEAPFNEKIIRSDKHEINVIPDDNPSKPSIKLIAFVIPTIQPIVIVYVNI